MYPPVLSMFSITVITYYIFAILAMEYIGGKYKYNPYLEATD